MRATTLQAVVLLSVFLAACGSSSSADNPKNTPGAKCTGDAGSGTCVTDVIGQIVNETSAPVADAPVSFCGDVCYYGQTDQSGAYDVEVKANIDPSIYHVLIHARPFKASFYYPVPPDAKDGVIDAGTSLLLALPTDGPTIATNGSGAPAQTLVSGDVTLDIPDGVDVRLDIEDVSLGADADKFRALTVPPSDFASFVPSDLGVLALYALGPFEATFDVKGTKTPAKASVSFTNTTGLAANTPVELLAMGSYYVEQAFAPGEFGPVANGHVSADGSTVSLDAGEGIQYVTWLGLREKK